MNHPQETNCETIMSASMRADRRIIVSLFNYTGHMVAPWLDAGYTCYCVDLLHPPGETREGRLIRVGADVRDWLQPFARVKMLFAFSLAAKDQRITFVC